MCNCLISSQVINSLLKQTYPPTLIRINIPKIFKRTKENYKIPIFITNNPKIKIFQYEQDYGPIMKFLPTIIDYKNDNNKVIIYGDDDVLFLPKTIETYLKFIIINPNNVYCLTGFTYNTLDNWTETSNTNNIIDKINYLLKFFSHYFPLAKISMCSSTESESVKLFCNSFYATKIQYFTEIKLLCDKLDIDYDNVKNLMISNNWINPMHTDVPGPDGNISFGGACFPKDIQALNSVFNKLHISNAVIDSVVKENKMMRCE